MPRIFVGIPFFHDRVVTEEQAELKKILAGSRIKWVEPGNFHITLRFLGEVSSLQLVSIHTALEQAASRSLPMTLELGKPGFFGSPRSPKVLWYGLQPDDRLQALSNSLDEAMPSLGFAREENAFHAHITLGRVISINATEVLEKYFSRRRYYPEKKEVSSIQLLKSDLRPQGPVYSLIREYKLQGKN